MFDEKQSTSIVEFINFYTLGNILFEIIDVMHRHNVWLKSITYIWLISSICAP